MNAPDQQFGFADLISAWRGCRAWKDKHPELARYHRARYDAFVLAFGIDLGKPPGSSLDAPKCLRQPGHRPNPSWAVQLHGFVLRVEAQADEFKSPWSGYIEVPSWMATVFGRYSGSIGSAIEDARGELRGMSDDLLAVLFPDVVDRTVSREDLMAGGFDPEMTAPDPLDYW